MSLKFLIHVYKEKKVYLRLDALQSESDFTLSLYASFQPRPVCFTSTWIFCSYVYSKNDRPCGKKFLAVAIMLSVLSVVEVTSNVSVFQSTTSLYSSFHATNHLLIYQHTSDQCPHFIPLEKRSGGIKGEHKTEMG